MESAPCIAFYSSQTSRDRSLGKSVRVIIINASSDKTGILTTKYYLFT